MKKDGRYDVSGLHEAQFEPGLNEQVLRNRLGIKSPREMDDAEARALETAMVELVGEEERVSIGRPRSFQLAAGWLPSLSRE